MADNAIYQAGDQTQSKTTKLVIIGDGAVGKTCFLMRFCRNEFPDVHIPTVFENYTHRYPYNGVENVLKIFDTAGQEEYKDVRTLAYPDTNVLIIAFSIVSRQSFDNVKTVWMEEMKNHMRPVPKTIMLVGTKSDLKDDSKALGLLATEAGPDAKPVTKGEGQALANEIKAFGYYETSAKTGQGCTQVMNAAIEAVEEGNVKCCACM